VTPRTERIADAKIESYVKILFHIQLWHARETDGDENYSIDEQLPQDTGSWLEELGKLRRHLRISL
jgi:hypothetical protein